MGGLLVFKWFVAVGWSLHWFKETPPQNIFIHWSAWILVRVYSYFYRLFLSGVLQCSKYGPPLWAIHLRFFEIGAFTIFWICQVYLLGHNPAFLLHIQGSNHKESRSSSSTIKFPDFKWNTIYVAGTVTQVFGIPFSPLIHTQICCSEKFINTKFSLHIPG